MVGTRHEIGGETFIVSDDVDVAELDLEQMVHKGDIVESVEYVRAYGATEPQKKKLSDAPPVPVERIGLTIGLRQAGTKEFSTHACLIETMHTGDLPNHSSGFVASYKVLMTRETAIKISMLSVHCAISGTPLLIERLCASFAGDTEELSLSQESHVGMSRFQMWDTKLDSPLVEVEFYIVPTGGGD